MRGQSPFLAAQRPWASTGHGSSKSFCHPSKILPFGPSFWSLEDYHSFRPLAAASSISFWQAGFAASGPSNLFPHFPLAPEISREGFDHNVTLTSAILAVSLHFQVNPDPNPVSSSTSIFCLMICRALQPSSAQFLLHISSSTPSIVRSPFPPIYPSNYSQQ